MVKKTRQEMRKVTQSRKNGVILIGEVGVGKTDVVEGLAKRITAGKLPAG